MNDKLRQAAQQVLEALDTLQRAYREAVGLYNSSHHDGYTVKAHNAGARLRAALMSASDGAEPPAEQSAEHGEPVAWIDITDQGQIISGPRLYQDGSREERPLYTTPQPAQQCNCVKRESLTDFDIADRFYAIGGAGANSLRYFAAGVRYAEATHGIGGEV